MRKLLSLIVLLPLAFVSCVTIKYSEATNTNTSPQTLRPLPFAKLYTAVWMQRAAEYKGLCLQAYNLAEWRLEEALQNPQNQGKKLAVITDIDETFLDNSPNSVHQARKNLLYESQSWHEWCAKACADTLPGALRFFSKAAKAGVEVFYISNRSEQDRNGTLRNLKAFGFPYADDAHLLLRGNTSDKEERRLAVTQNYEVILYLGDNLGDFLSVFDSPNEQERERALFNQRNQIGRRFILLPNPNYGNWETALHGGTSGSISRQTSTIESKAKGYK